MYRFIVRVHRPALLAFALATLVAAASLVHPGLKVDYRLEAFVASDNEAYRRFRRFMEEFASNEIALIAVESDDATSPETLAVVEWLTRRVKPIESVQRVLSITEIPSAIRSLWGDRLLGHPLFQDNIISRDGRTTAVVMQMSGEDVGGAVRKRTVARLRSITAEATADHPEMRIVLAGPYVTLIDMYDYVTRDLVVFSTAALVLLGATLWIVFRRVGPMLFAVAVSLGAMFCTLGLAVAFGVVTSLITQMIVILVIVLSVASCVHLAVASEETALHAANGSWREQAATTLTRMAAPCTAVIATTAVGFASVCVSPISPVRRFGVLMVCGLCLSLIYALLATAAVAGRRPSRAARTWLPRGLRAVGQAAVRSRWSLFLVFAAATIVCAIGIRGLRFESDFVKNFRTDSTVRRSYNFIGQRLAPVGSMEIVVQGRNGRGILTPECVQTADAFARRIVDRYEWIEKSQTLGDVLTLFREKLPETALDLRMRLALVEAVPDGRDFLRNFLNEDRSALRINFRAREGVSVREKLRAAGEIRDAAARAFGDAYSAQVTGLYYFYANLVSGLLRDQYRSVAITIPAVFVLLLIVFRSWRVAAVAMVPNLLPVVFCIGVMGWTGIPVNLTTAMMLSVTFGIAVDDTIHYVWRFREELTACGDYAQAVANTHASVGRACVFTTVVIAGGFWILVLSEFLPTAYFGGLVGFTMLGTLAADLLLLPALLVVFRPFGTRHPHALRLSPEP